MGVAITFCNKTQHEGGDDKQNNAFLHGSKPKSLPHLIQFAAPGLQFIACSFWRVPNVSCEFESRPLG
jgi:hypothetical protein